MSFMQLDEKSGLRSFGSMPIYYSSSPSPLVDLDCQNWFSHMSPKTRMYTIFSILTKREVSLMLRIV